MRPAVVRALVLAVAIGAALGPAPAAFAATGTARAAAPEALAAAQLLAQADAAPGAPAPSPPPAAGVRPALPRDLSLGSMIVGAHPVVQAIMALLAAASLASWAIFGAKAVAIVQARRGVRADIALLRNTRSLDEVERYARTSPVTTEIIRAAIAEVDLSYGLPIAGIKERVAARLAGVEAGRGRAMAAGIGVLATVGATAPFVGLFGTVFGIMNSFVGIAEAETTNLVVVAPGIAEALLATAFGLLAAIPAAILYNVLSRWLAAWRAELAEVAADVLRLVGRDLDRWSANVATQQAAQ